MRQSTLKDPEALNITHFGCDTEGETPVISTNVKQYLIKIMAIVEDSQLLPYERIDGGDFCAIVKGVVAGIRRVIAIDAKCAETNAENRICYGNCGMKKANPLLRRIIYEDTPPKYDEMKKTRLDGRKPEKKKKRVERPEWINDWTDKPSQPSSEKPSQKLVDKPCQQPDQPNRRLTPNQKRNQRRKKRKAVAAKNVDHFQALPLANGKK